MFRSVFRSVHLLNCLASSTCPRFCKPADDVTKFASGCLQLVVHRDHHQGAQVPLTQECSVTLCLGFHHLPTSPVARNLNMGHPALSSLTRSALCQPMWLGLSAVQAMNYSTGEDGKAELSKATSIISGEQSKNSATEEKLSIFQRFKRAYKEHGKVLVVVHLATSTVWFGFFYAIARGGFDIVPWLEHWGFSDTVIKPFRAGGLGDIAVAYLMYKLATPARYTVTLAGTNLAIRHLRSRGKMAPKSQEDSLRELYKEGRQKLKNSKLRQDRLKKLREARQKKKLEQKQRK